MSSLSPYPEAARLERDLVRLTSLTGRPFGEYLGDGVLWQLADSRRKNKLSLALSEHLGGTDERIRYVNAHAKGYPSGTMKLFGALELAEARRGERLARILNGGAVAVAVAKLGSPSDWRITGIHRFLPAGKELEACERALEELAWHFLRRRPGEPFASMNRPPFQIRTGSNSGGYAVYLLAGAYFGGQADE